MKTLQSPRLEEPAAENPSVSVRFGRESFDVPDGSVLYLKDMEPDDVGDIVIQALQFDPVNIVSDSAPVATGNLPPTGAEYGPCFVQFESVRIISDAELNIIILPDS